MRWLFHEKAPASCLMQGRKNFFTRYHPDLRIFSMRLHWACIGANRHGLNVLAHACSGAMFSRAAPPLSTIRGSLWTRPSGYSPLPGIYRLSYDFPKEMSRKNYGRSGRPSPCFKAKAGVHFRTPAWGKPVSGFRDWIIPRSQQQRQHRRYDRSRSHKRTGSRPCTHRPDGRRSLRQQHTDQRWLPDPC